MSSSSLGCCDCCCCCCICQYVHSYCDLGWWPWCCESFEKYSSTVLKSHSISAISRHCCVGDDCKMVSSARIAILDPALLTILCITPNLDCVSNVSHSTGFLKNSVIKITRFFFPGLYKRLIVGPCHSLVLREIYHSPKWIENSTKFICGRCAPSNCKE